MRRRSLFTLLFALSSIACPGGDDLTINTAALPQGTIGEAYSATLTAAGGSEEGYVWRLMSGTLPVGLEIAAEGTPSTTVSGTPDEDGTFDFVVQVTDSDGTTATRSVRLVVGGEVGPKELSIVTASLPDGELGVAYSATIEGSGGAEAGYAWSVTDGSLPSGLTLQPDGTPSTTLAGTPDADGTYDFTLQLTDADGTSVTQNFTVEIVAGAGLRVVTTDLPMATVGEAYTTLIVAAGGSGMDYTWQITAGTLPAGVTIRTMGTPSVGLEGTPTEPGSFDFTVRVTDSDANQAERLLTLNVTAAQVTLITQVLPDGAVTAPYAATVEAGGGTPPYTFNIVGGALPDGLTLAADGAIAGTPTADGDFTFTVEAEDSVGTTVDGMLTISIAQRVRILTTMLPSGREGAVYTASVSATGGAGTDYQWSVVQGTLPGGLALSTMGTPTATISGSPTEWGDFTFTVRVDEPLGTFAEQQLTLQLLPIPIQISTATVPPGLALSAYAAVITTINGSLTTYTWTSSGALPPGLALDPAGTPPFTSVTGVPSLPGVYTATVSVTDDLTGDTDARSFTFDIAAPPITISTVNLPPPEYGTAYAESIDTVGGSGAGYVWSVIAGSLPTGLSIDLAGTPTTLSGYPLEQGTFSFTLQVQDSFGTIATQAYTLTVNRPLTLLTGALPTVVAGTNYSATLQAVGGTNLGYTWSVSLGTPPPGLVLGAGGTPSTVLAGTTNTPGLYTFNVRVTDSAGNAASQRINLQVRTPQTLGVMIGDLLVNNDTEVFVVQLAGGTAPIRVNPAAPGTGDASTAFDAAKISPDGTRLAFIGDFTVNNSRSLYVVSIANPVAQEISGPMVLNGNVLDFEWSPTSEQIAYRADQITDNVNELFLVDIRSGTPGPARRISGAMVLGGDVQTYAWTPDGVSVLYRADQTVDTQNELFLVDAEGIVPGAPQRVNAPMVAGGDVAEKLLFTPDGINVIYRADEATDNTFALVSVDILGGALSGRTQLNVRSNAADDYELSADGAWLLFVSDDETTNVFDLWVRDLRTPQMIPLKVNADFVDGNRDVVAAKWSPNSRQLAFVADADTDNQSELYVVDVPSLLIGPQNRASPVFTLAGSDVNGNLANGFGWSPDGTRIAYRADATADFVEDLWITDVSNPPPYAAARVSPVLPAFADVSFFQFSPSGQYLLYEADAAVNAQLELYVSDVTGAPTAPMQVNGTLPAGGDVIAALSFWDEASNRVYYRADQAVDNDFEAWAVDIINGAPGTPAQLNGALPAGGDVNVLTAPRP